MHEVFNYIKVDRILKLLETTEGRAAVISSQYDLSNAYERQDPTKNNTKIYHLENPFFLDSNSDRFFIWEVHENQI